MIRALFVSLTLASPSVANERAMQMLNDWIAMVERHAAGERDQALADLGAWTGDELELMRTYVQALAGVPTNDQERANRRRSINGVEMAAIKTRIMDLEALGRFDEFRKRAALLHTDAALFEFAPVVVDAPVARNLKPRRDEAEPAIDVKTVDGRVERYEVANPHWQFALDLLESLPAQPQRDPLVAQWYRAIGAYFAEQDNSADAMRLFERARRIVPDHPDVLFGEACLQETLGGPDVQNFARTATLPNGLTLRGVTSPQAHFKRAEALLRRALTLRPDFVEARLRLGHVLAEQRQHEAALPHFAQVIAGTRDAVLTYYAHLLAGDAALALDRPADSRASYERALASHPDAQAARIGLAAALRAAGDRPAAVAAVMITLTAPPKSRGSEDDPWWVYYRGDAANVERLLDELRTPYRIPLR